VTRRDDLYTTARRALARGYAASWEAAEAMAELVERGETQRQIAAQLGCSQRTVSNYVRVFREHGVLSKKPPFAEAMATIRNDAERMPVPKTPERKAELVAELLQDKAVADAPAVRKVQQRHADRRLRAEVAAANRDHGIPTRTEEARDRRRLSVVENASVWFLALDAVQRATRALNDMTGEIERTGLPRKGSGETIRAVRALIRAAQRFEEAATSAGIGQAM